MLRGPYILFPPSINPDITQFIVGDHYVGYSFKKGTALSQVVFPLIDNDHMSLKTYKSLICGTKAYFTRAINHITTQTYTKNVLYPIH